MLIGAFGAHGLKPYFGPGMKAVYETGVQYHLVHALMIFVCALVANDQSGKHMRTFATNAGLLFALGITLFSGSLYVLAITQLKWFGAITPLGGLAFLAGYVYLFLSTRSQKV